MKNVRHHNKMMQKPFQVRLKSAINFVHAMLEKGDSKKRALETSANYYQIGVETLEYETFGYIADSPPKRTNAKAVAKVYHGGAYITHATDDANNLDCYFALVDAMTQ